MDITNEEITEHEANLQAIAEYRMIDDTFLSAVFDGRIEETELLLRIILEREDIIVESVKAQFFFSNLYGHEVRIDIVARDRTGKVYSVEVQRDMAEASVRRARFNGAMVDVSLLKKGQKYKELPDRYTIFITEEDMFHKGFPVYHAENTVKELKNAPLEDGGHIIYVNGQYRNTDTPIGRLMHDFYCTNPDDMLNPLFRDRVSYLKKTEGGQKEMDMILERRINEDISCCKGRITCNLGRIIEAIRTDDAPEQCTSQH